MLGVVVVVVGLREALFDIPFCFGLVWQVSNPSRAACFCLFACRSALCSVFSLFTRKVYIIGMLHDIFVLVFRTLNTRAVVVLEDRDITMCLCFACRVVMVCECQFCVYLSSTSVFCSCLPF